VSTIGIGLRQTGVGRIPKVVDPTGNVDKNGQSHQRTQRRQQTILSQTLTLVMIP
jgi:hypothetical protein